MKVSIPELKAKMTDVPLSKDYDKNDIPFVINMYLGTVDIPDGLWKEIAELKT